MYRIRVLMLLVVLLAFTSTFGDIRQYGFTGEIQEIDLADFSKHIQEQSLAEIMAADRTSKVKVLAVGAKKLTAPVSPYSPHFVYYAYNLIAIDEWWVAVIVTNWDDKDHQVTVNIDVRGALTDTVAQQVEIKAYSAKLVSAQIELTPKIGMFHFTGKAKGPEVDTSTVKSKLYIFDVL